MAINREKMKRNFKASIEKAKEQAESRNYREAIEVQISLRNIDLDQPENRFTTRIVLPHPVTVKDKIGIFASDAHLSTLEDIQEEMDGEIQIISERKFDRIKTDARTIKKLAEDVRIFLASVSLMGDIGKHLGRYLAPRNKMPIPLPIGADLREIIQRAKRTIQIRLRDDPIIYSKIGEESIDNEKLADNALALLQEIIEEVPNRWNNIKEIGFKTTMGPRIEAR